MVFLLKLSLIPLLQCPLYYFVFRNSVNIDLAYMVAINAAHSAGKFIKEMRATHSFSESIKGEGYNLVTSADIGAEKIILDEIRNNFPDANFLSEETNPTDENREHLTGDLWIVDPLDGTINFAHNHVHVCVSIAFASQGVVQFGVVYAPFLNETFSAKLGGRACLNDSPISIREPVSIESAIISTGYPYSAPELAPRLGKHIEDLVLNRMNIRRIGAAALDLCWIACGRLSAHFEYRLKPWDVAAGSLIARCAGALHTTISDNPNPNGYPVDFFADEILVATPKLLPKLKEILK